MIDDDLIYIHIGKKIKTVRDKADLTQESLADAIGVSRASIANYESGKQSIYISDLYKIADALNIEIRELLPPLQEIKMKSLPEKQLKEAKNLTEKEKKEIVELIEKKYKEEEQ